MEATRAVHPDRDPRTVSRDELAAIGLALSERSGRPVFLTLSEEGVLVCADGQHQRLPSAPVRPPLDPVGAGDAFIAAMAAAGGWRKPLGGRGAGQSRGRRDR